MDEKMIQYRALKIAEKRGLSEEEALSEAHEEIRRLEKRRKEMKKAQRKGGARRQMLPRKGKKAARTVYVVSGRVIDRIFSGGLPSLGKRK